MRGALSTDKDGHVASERQRQTSYSMERRRRVLKVGQGVGGEEEVLGGREGAGDKRDMAEFQSRESIVEEALIQ